MSFGFVAEGHQQVVFTERRIAVDADFERPNDVSVRDLYKALGPRSRRRSVVRKSGETALYVIPRRVRHIMRRGVITVDPETDAAKAATMMARKKIGALPVVTKGRLVGIITATDILLAFARMTAEAKTTG